MDAIWNKFNYRMYSTSGVGIIYIGIWVISLVNISFLWHGYDSKLLQTILGMVYL